MGAADFWNNPEQAQKIVAQVKSLKVVVEAMRKFMREMDDLKVLHELAEAEKDQAARQEVSDTLTRLEGQLERMETQALLSGKHDHRNAFLSIYAGDGGTEANDWAEMMLRMYLKFIEKMGWGVEEVDAHKGEEAGIKDVTLRITGEYVFGHLICERGTHRLARVSPFNAQGKRQTSFATVDVTPELEDVDVTINERDCDIEFFVRASGPGGQNVNKVATACRILHRPTGLTVTCSNERSQGQNKKIALGILQAKIDQLEEERKAAERTAGGKLEMGWGTQIRSYVIYDNRVKDTRTGHEVMNPQRVLDGDLYGFIEAELKRRNAELRKAQAAGSTTA
jgi:peptide chain release factor 2